MLLSNKFKIPGYILVSAGGILTVLYFWFDFRFEIPVFAFFSSYMETRFFTSFKTNFADELILLTLLCGFTIIVFSKERNEQEFFETIRIKALITAIFINISLLIFSVIFIYGAGFMSIVMLNIFLPFILYLVFFNIMKFKAQKK